MKRVHHHMFRARILQYLLALWRASSSSCFCSSMKAKSILNSEEKEKDEKKQKKKELSLIHTLPPLLQGVSITAEELKTIYGITSENELIATVFNDQIVWGRVPARIDLSSGWTDTPPYSIICGGNVVNMGINLNSQPPLQVYIKPSVTPDITIRSIDLGVSETFTTYEELRRYDVVGSPYSIPKAALTLAVFLP
ncbi:hypothetical protein LSM04_001293 [Trypanosoma melophagium]|nr:hypothetical protein LSM04_001293 [Trypanosoma melophagium]